MAIGKEHSFLEAQSVRLEYRLNPGGQRIASPIGGEIVRQGSSSRLIAVKDVSFKLAAGESLGLIGHNGCGKTTLLRLLAGIFLPTSGSIRSRGVVGNALNPSLGFRPEATGRRNIALKGLISGMRRSEIDQLVADVEDFAELGPFLDQPLYTYSAGMRARLTFGVATAIPFDVLILDEWLGAGDKSMQEKVAARMAAFVSKAAIVVLASHSAAMLRDTCTKGLVMNHGSAVFFGDIDAAIDYYAQAEKA
ncbi:ABC transporter ATP-binding protein [Pseudohoeflea coraliihabitans]|uniref:ABC transporter ATP-binding protein n=1 Tax=Pseudohoeflea coraliihabitans TaxID=2860393 RepID=A0ABS6WLR4_9HYPH|nr:ABC transporter ATP-binding protein [Pseudohoeflea sp. DP4N28-3]MBW3096893.1 ABC transporter ATP-binding protein [Pseudohoeflea sp. DP4N28-3]